MIRILSSLLLCFGLAFAAEAQQATRRALVIGISDYDHVSALPGARADAEAVSSFLKEDLNFDAVTVSRPHETYQSLVTLIDTFQQSVNKGDEVVLWYAGHGIQVEEAGTAMGRLLASDAPAAETVSVNGVRRLSYSVADLVKEMEARDARLNVIIIDACRDNPYPGHGAIRGGPAGFVSNTDRKNFETLNNTFLILSATAPQKALDYDPKRRKPNSLFATEFLINASDKVRSFEQVASQTRDAVFAAAEEKGHTQRPEYYSRVSQCFNLWRGYGEACPVPSAAPGLDAGTLLWLEISKRPANEERCRYLDQYLTGHPDGEFAEAARWQKAQPPCTASVAQTTPSAGAVSASDRNFVQSVIKAAQAGGAAAERARAHEQTGRIKASSAATGVSGLSSQGYNGDMPVQDFFYGEFIFGGRSQGEGYTGQFDGSDPARPLVRSSGVFIYPQVNGAGDSRADRIRRYEGDFAPGGGNAAGNLHGYGASIHYDGEEFSGQFRDGAREGLGILRKTDGLEIYGLWARDGSLIKGLTFDPAANAFLPDAP